MGQQRGVVTEHARGANNTAAGAATAHDGASRRPALIDDMKQVITSGASFVEEEDSLELAGRHAPVESHA